MSSRRAEQHFKSAHARRYSVGQLYRAEIRKGYRVFFLRLGEKASHYEILEPNRHELDRGNPLDCHILRDLPFEVLAVQRRLEALLDKREYVLEAHVVGRGY